MRVLAACVWAALVLACREEPIATTVPGGDVDEGRRIITAYQCGACHTIPGVRGARGVVGPPLTQFGRRAYIGGVLPNTPDNVIRWVLDPPRYAPRTAMPAMGLDAQQARHVAAYLVQLR